MTGTQKNLRGRALVFSREEYESGNGMMTAIWGPSTWHLLHTASFNYPLHPTQLQKKQYRQFILHLQFVLPCGKCRENFKKNIRELPLDWKHMKSRKTFSTYIYNLHELVNKMLGKTSNLSYHAVRDRYEHFRSRCSTAETTRRSRRSSRSSSRGNDHDHEIEHGCIEPAKGRKTKCVLRILPLEDKGKHDFQLCSRNNV